MPDLLENLNPEQLKAVTFGNGPLLIVAGAGTGKTTVITRRIAWLLQQKLCKPDEILALTFTDKAAGEMEERLDLLLPLGSFDMWISTFHSFCQRILEQYALDIGLPNNFKLINDTRQWLFVYKNFDRFQLDYYRPIGSPHKFIDALLRHFSRCKDELITPEDYLKYAEEMKLGLDNPDFLKSDGGGVDILVEIKRIEELAGAFHTYQQLLLENEVLDFGDLINYTLKLLSERPNILNYYRNKFKYILVDEFQDTNVAQYDLVKFLAGSATSNKREAINKKDNSETVRLPLVAGNLTVVGDDDQAIYKFRGASVSNILKFKEDFANLTEITLTQNYRSSQEILDMAYNFIQNNNPNRLEVRLGISKRLMNPAENETRQLEVINRKQTQSIHVIPAKAGIQDNKLCAHFSDAEIKHTEPYSGQPEVAQSGSPAASGMTEHAETEIKVLEGKDLSEELNLVVKQTLEIRNHEMQNRESESSWNDFAILIRSNSASEEILPKLEAAGIPFIYLANKGLYKKPLIANLISYLKLLDNYHESGALYRVLNFPKFRLDAERLAGITQFVQRKTLSLYEALQNQELRDKLDTESKEKIDCLLKLLSSHTLFAKDKTAVELFVAVVGELGLPQILEEETLENAQNREFLEQFYKQIEQYEQESDDKSLRGFMESLELETRAGNEGQIQFDPNVGPEALKVLTIHSAKGLEFENVFVVNMVDQRFPTRGKKDAIEIPEPLIKDILPEGDFHLQEERRLFYVAATRAKKRLYFSWSKDYGGARVKKPSIFLVESGLIPGEKVSKATGKVVLGKANANSKKQVYKVIPTSFSYSAINSFLQCPLEYKYAHYLKLPLPGSPYFSFGQTIHKVFEQYLLQYKKQFDLPQQDLFGAATKPVLAPLRELESLYEKHWVDEWYLDKRQKEEYREKGKGLIKVFYDEITARPPQVKYLEKFFKLKFGEYEFVGKIDRADNSPQGLSIIDYKTGKPPKSKADENVDQLRIYQLAVQDFLREKVASLSYWYLEGNQFKEVELATSDELVNLQEHLLETIKKIVEAVKFDLFRELHYNTKQHNCKFEGWE